MDASDSLFEYNPLSDASRDIRLLEIQPQLNAHDDLVRCRIIQSSTAASAPQPYETISYCWGDAARSARLIVDGRYLHVPENTAKVVRSVRLPGQTRIVWIDSICINQDDKDEKEAQILLTDRIFRLCDRNLVCLGEDDGTAAEAFNTVRRLYASDSSVVDLDHSSPAVHALEQLFLRPWFFRLWVMQETILPPKNLVILGTQQIDLSEITQTGAATLGQADWTSPRSVLRRHFCPEAAAGLAIAENINSLRGQFVDMRKWIESGRNGPTPYWAWGNIAVLSSCNIGRKVTLNHDRVYALSGLLRDHLSEVPLPPALVPNYTKSVQDLFRDATLFTINERKDLFVLRNLSHLSDRDLQLDGFCSWVPRWDLKVNESGHPHDLGFWRNASGPIREDKYPAPSHNIDILAWPGVQVDFVQTTFPIFTDEMVSDSNNLLSMIVGIDEFVKDIRANATYPELADLSDPHQHVLASTLIAGEVGLGNASDSDLQLFYSFRNELERIQAAGEGMAAPKLQIKSDNEARHYKRLLRSACLWRRIFITRGGLIGLGPRSTRGGDVVAILYNCPWPFILRPIENEGYHMLGASYVDGLMEGAAMHRHHESGRPDMVFNVR